MCHDQSFEALHNYQDEGYWPIAIEACHCGHFGDRKNCGCLQTGGDCRLSEGGIEGVRVERSRTGVEGEVDYQRLVRGRTEVSLVWW